MKKLSSKIIYTILLSLFVLFIARLVAIFAYGVFDYDDDKMFIAGLILMVITCVIVLVNIISYDLAQIWGKPKNKKVGGGNDSKRNSQKG